MKKTTLFICLLLVTCLNANSFAQEQVKPNYEDNQIVISNYLKIKNIKPDEGCFNLTFDENGTFEVYDSYVVGEGIFYLGDVDFANVFSKSSFITSNSVEAMKIYQRNVNGWGYNLSETEGVFFLSNTSHSDTLSYDLYSPDELTTINPFCTYSKWKLINVKKTDLNDFMVESSGYTRYDSLKFNPTFNKKKLANNSKVKKLAIKFLSTYGQEFRENNLRFMEQAQEIKIELKLKNNKTIIYYLVSEIRTAEC